MGKVERQFNKEFVSLGDSLVSDKDIEETLSNHSTDHIEVLQLQTNQITLQGVRHLKKSNWECLKMLDLCCNSIGSQGCREISRMGLPSLCRLYTRDNNIGSEGLTHLGKAKLPSLERVSIGWNHYQNNGFKGLLRLQSPIKTIYTGNSSLKDHQMVKIVLAQWPLSEWISFIENELYPFEKKKLKCAIKEKCHCDAYVGL